jgi:hypothetical protein
MPRSTKIILASVTPSGLGAEALAGRFRFLIRYCRVLAAIADVRESLLRVAK